MRALPITALALALLACGPEPAASGTSAPVGDAAGSTPGPDAGAEDTLAPPALTVPELGDGVADFTVIGTAADGLANPRDLDFHPWRPDELWTVNEANDGVVIYFGAGTDAQSSEARVDAWADHFMAHVSSIAMGDDDTFGTCQESNNDWDGTQAPDGHMGPTLWPSDLEVFAKVNQDGERDGLGHHLLGSHLDMLHESPLCMGIAHDTEHTYWVFDGHHGKIVRYDFRHAHGYGEDDHSDGEIHSYEELDVTRTVGVPSHLALDQEARRLYVADTGTGRILWLDVDSGAPTEELEQHWNVFEYVDTYRAVTGATHGVLAEGFTRPSGLALHEGRLLVSDHDTAEIVALSLSGEELARLQTPAQGIMGLVVGRHGHLWYTDGPGDQVVRIDP